MDDQPRVITKDFRSTGLDIFKLAKTKEWPQILRMLRVVNDRMLVPSISFFLEFRPQSAHLEQIKNGIDWHLLRWNCAVTAEALSDVIEPLQKKAADPDNEIWQVIRSKPTLIAKWEQLQQYLGSGANKQILLNARTVRDKLLAHYDLAPLKRAFEKTLEIHREQGAVSVLDWHIQTANDGGQLTRNLLIDKLVNLAWYEAFQIPYTSEGPDQAKLEQVTESLEAFLKLVVEFVHSVVVEFCEKYDLTNIDVVPPWIEEDDGQGRA